MMTIPTNHFQSVVVHFLIYFLKLFGQVLVITYIALYQKRKILPIRHDSCLDVILSAFFILFDWMVRCI